MEHAFIKSDDKMRYTLGIVYAPDEEDSQGDVASVEEIEKACHEFMRHIQGRLKKGALGYMHKEWPDDIGDIVECYCAPADMEIGDVFIAKGTWLLGAVWSEDVFQKIENGDITGYSMGGTGHREAVEKASAFQKILKGMPEGNESIFHEALRAVIEGR